MKNKKIAVALVAALVAVGCEDKGTTRSNPNARAAGDMSFLLHYSYPLDAQAQVAPRAPVALGFSDIVAASAENFIFQDAEGNDVPFDLTVVNDGRGVVLTPQEALSTATEYSVVMDGVSVAGFPVQFADGALDFTTRAAFDTEGALADQQTSGTFEVASIFPNDELFESMDFSSFRMATTQPIDHSSVGEYGDNISLTCDGELVPSLLLVGRTQITVDPDEDLTPGASCEISVSGLTNTLDGAEIAAFSHSTVPQNTAFEGERAIMVTQAPAADDCEAPSGDSISPLTGTAINCVPVNSTLLQDKTISKQSGDVFAELANVVAFPDVTPLRVNKGSILTGEALKVLVGGEVDVGWDSGEVLVEIISDATGYLYPNPNSDDEFAPKNLRLFMDVAFSTGDARANGAFTQNLLHLELAGTASLVDGVLVANAISVVEPKVLGVEYGYGVLSFQMASYLDQDNTPPPRQDTDVVGPFIPELDGELSWQPGTQPGRIVPGEPIVVHFNEVLDPQSVAPQGSVILEKDGAPADFEWKLDGSALVIRPAEPLAFGASYTVRLNAELTDLVGNPLQEDYTLAFTMPAYAEGDGVEARAPFLTSTYPGFPCAVDTSSADIANNVQGHCQTFHDDTAHDLLPIDPLPGNRPIQIRFSQNMDPASLEAGFSVSELDASGNPVGTVEGKVEAEPRVLTFIPQEKWQDGVLYSYTLNSNDGATTCEADDICSAAGQPLQTAMLLGSPADQGGPDMTVMFRGVDTVRTIFQNLGNLPRLDVNTNLVVDGVEETEGAANGLFKEEGYVFANDIPQNSTFLRPVGDGASGQFLVAANIGCGFESDQTTPLECDDKKLLYITADLNAELIDYDPDATDLDGVAGGVPVVIYPNQALLGNLHAVATMGLSSEDDVDEPCIPIPLLGELLCDILEPVTDIVQIPVEVDTGPNVMRVRYVENEEGETVPPVGIIRNPDGEGPVFSISLDLLFDAPQLAVLGGAAEHNVKNLVIPDVQLEGPVEFLPDGRLFLSLLNRQALNVSMHIQALGLDAGDVNLEIPVGGINLSYQSTSIQ